ncbi:unnamed protein product, partial [Allacma fusca]
MQNHDAMLSQIRIVSEDGQNINWFLDELEFFDRRHVPDVDGLDSNSQPSDSFPLTAGKPISVEQAIYLNIWLHLNFTPRKEQPTSEDARISISTDPKLLFVTRF